MLVEVAMESSLWRIDFGSKQFDSSSRQIPKILYVWKNVRCHTLIQKFETVKVSTIFCFLTGFPTENAVLSSSSGSLRCLAFVSQSRLHDRFA